MRFLLSIFVVLALGTNAAAQTQDTDIRKDAKRVKGDALVAAYLNTTHLGAYNFSEDGKPQRTYKEKHFEDSKSIYTENGHAVDGMWTINRNLLCYAYPGQAMEGGCFRVYKLGNCYYYYDDMIPEYGLEYDRDYWTARSVKAGDEANCEAMVS